MPNELLTRPSKKQRELLEYLKGFIAQHGYGPSYREIMRALDYKSVSTVAVHIEGLIAKGLLEKRDRSARSLVVLDSPKASIAPSATYTVDSGWLVDEVERRFVAYYQKPSKTKLDNLYVLVGALHVLGLTEPARSYKARLKTLAKTD